jgi:hypothetical protein
MTEEWRPAVGLETLYEVSNLGNVRRAKALKPKLNKQTGRREVTISSNQPGSRSRLISHLVASAFLGPRPPKMVINHRDGDKTNDNAENLEYITQSENQQHGLALAVLRGTGNRIGTRNKSAKLTPQAVREIRQSNEPLHILAARYGVSKHPIWAVKQGMTWKHVQG